MPIVILIVLLVLVILVGWFVRSGMVLVGKDQVLYVSGGTQKILDPTTGEARVAMRIYREGRAFVWPVLQKAEYLSLKPIPVSLLVCDGYTESGVPVAASGLVEIKPMEDDRSLRRAADVWLSKTSDEIAAGVRPIVEGHLKVVLSDSTLVRDPLDRHQVAQALQSESTPDLEMLGLEVVSLTLQDIHVRGSHPAVGEKATGKHGKV